MRNRWRATGEARVNRLGWMRADIQCECGYLFSSALQDAIDACNVVRLAKGLEPVKFGRVEVDPPAPDDVGGLKVPQPSLPMPIVRQSSSAFTQVSSMAADFKARQSGERESGEEG